MQNWISNNKNLLYVIVITRLIFDTMHTLHETRGRSITIISPPTAVLDALQLDLAGLLKEDELGLVLFLFTSYGFY